MTASTDWKNLFQDILTQGGVPSPSATSIDGNQAIFRAMYVDLAAVQAEIRSAGCDPQQVIIYADVLDIPENFRWFPTGKILTVIARRIEAGTGSRLRLDWREGNHLSGLMLLADEVGGTIEVVGAEPGGTAAQFQFSSLPGEGGVLVRCRDGKGTQTALTRAQGLAIDPPPALMDAFGTAFIVASLLFDRQPLIAVNMLRWLVRWTRVSPVFKSTFLRSSSALALLSAQVEAGKTGAAFVPYLSRAVYADLAGAFVAQAQQYEANWRLMSIEKVVTDRFIELARTLLDNQISQSQYVTRLTEQAKVNFDNAVVAVDDAGRNFDTAKLKAQLVKADFEHYGIPEWIRNQIIKGVVDLAGAAISFGVGVAGLLAGNPAAGAAAVGGAVQGAGAVAAAASAGSALAGTASKLAETMANLKKLLEALNQIYQFSRAVTEAIQKFNTVSIEKLKGMELPEAADITATAHWQSYRQHATANLEDPVQKGVRYARELRSAVEDIAIFGQALASAQAATIRAGQDYAALQLQKQLAETQQQRLEAWVNQLVAGSPPVDAMMQEFYLRYLDAKSSLFTAVQQYRASFYYWALEPSDVDPKIIDGVHSINSGLDKLTSMALDNQSAFNRFQPPPQVMLRKRVTIDSPAILTALNQDGQATWDIGFDTPTFAGFGRIRLSTVRVWLEQDEPVAADHTVTIQIATAGAYQDRLKGLSYQFTSKPLERAFQYRVSTSRQGPPDWQFANGAYGYIEVDGTVDREVAYAYFEPTPFAQWRVRPSIHSSGTDLSKVKRIVMEFSGSLIADLPRQG
jgi:hypothetical protein